MPSSNRARWGCEMKINPAYYYRCDFCGQETPLLAVPRRVTRCYRPIDPAGVEISAKGFGPGPGSEDVCDKCFDEAILKLAEKIQEAREKEGAGRLLRFDVLG